MEVQDGFHPNRCSGSSSHNCDMDCMEMVGSFTYSYFLGANENGKKKVGI